MLKKVLATLTGVLMLAQMAPVALVNGATYSQEMIDAYEYAYEKGITTQYPIDNANLYGVTTRAQLSKMIANWAEDVLGVKPDTSKSCTFTDAASAEGDLATYMVKACQMGLMGQGITEFRPNDVVTRGEFGTTLSRAIWGDEYNTTETPYYKYHLQALQQAGIMTIINNPDQKEIRGYVMIMLERAEETVDNPASICDDALTQLACTMDPDSAQCPAQCRDGDDTDNGDDVVKAGDLRVSIPDYSSAIKSVPSTGTSIFNQVKFQASETITLNGIDLERTGLSSKSDIKGVWFEQNGVRISSRGNVNTDGSVSITFNNGFKVKSNETIDLVVELAANVGAQVAFKIVSVDSSAEDVALDDKYTTTYQTAAYTVATVDFSRNGPTTGTTYKLGEQKTYELGKFEIVNNTTTADDKPVKVQSITLKNQGTADLSNLKNIKVIRDSETVSTNVTVDSKNMTIILNDTVEASKKAIYTIQAEISYVDRDGDTYQLYLNKDADLVAVEKDTNFRTTNNIVNGTLGVYTVKGGKIVFATDSSVPSSVDAGQGYTDVVIAAGTLTVTEPVMLDTLTLSGTVSTGSIGTIANKITVEIGGSRTAGTINGNVVVFDNEFYVSKTSAVKILLNVKNNAPANATLKLDPIRGTSFSKGEYQNSQSTFTPSSEIAGTIDTAKVTIKDAKFNLTKTSTVSEVTIVATDSAAFTLFEGYLSNTKSDTITVNDIVLAGTGVGSVFNSNGSIYFTLTAGDKSSSQTFNQNGSVTFSSLGLKLSSGNNVNVKIVGSPSIVATGSFTFNVTAQGTDTQGNQANTNVVNTANVKVTAGGSASYSSSNTVKNSAIAEQTSNQAIAQWTVTVKDETLTLKDVTIAASGAILGTPTLNSWTLEYVNGTTTTAVNGQADQSATALTMSDIDMQLAPGTYTFTARANIGTFSNTGSNLINITAVTSNFEGKAGVLPVNGALNYTHEVVKSVPHITMFTTRTSETDLQNIFGLRITNAAGEDPITLTSLNLTNTAIGNVEVLDANGIVIGSGASGAITLGAGVTINKGATQDLTVRAVTPLAAGSYGASLTDIAYSVQDGATIYTYPSMSAYTNVANWSSLTTTFRIAN